MLAQREHDYFAETVIWPTAILLPKSMDTHKRFAPTLLVGAWARRQLVLSCLKRKDIYLRQPAMLTLTSLSPTALSARGDDGIDAYDEGYEHKEEQQADGSVGALKLLPDKDAPQGGYHRRALAQGIADGRAEVGLFAGAYIAQHGAKTPDATAEDAHKVGGGTTGEILSVGDGLTGDGATHENGIKHKIAQEGSQGAEEEGAVGGSHACGGAGAAAEVHGVGHEGIEDAHEQTADDGEGKPLLADAATGGLGVLAGGYAVADDGAEHKGNAKGEQGGIAVGGKDVVEKYTKHQGDAQADRPCYGEARDTDGCREQDISRIENDTAQYGTAGTCSIELAKVGEEGTSALAIAAKGKTDYKREEQDAHDVVPVEEFIAPALAGQFLCVAPAAPA